MQCSAEQVIVDTRYITVYIEVHSCVLHYIVLHCITLQCIALQAVHCITVYIALHCSTSHCIALQAGCLTAGRSWMDGGWWVGRPAGSVGHRGDRIGGGKKGRQASREKNGQATGQWKRLASICWAREREAQASNTWQPGFCQGGQLISEENAN